MEGPLRLESWKEISAYLGRSVSTCHRWEEELALPIHRLDGTPKARVFAFPEELDRWMRDKLHLDEALTDEGARPRPLRRHRTAAAAAVLAVLAGLAAASWRFLLPAPAPFNNPWLVVIPFENAARDESLEPWSTAFADLLTTDLRQSRYVNVLALTEVDLALGKLGLSESRKFALDEIVKIAAELESDYVVTGTLVQADDDLIVKALVYDARARQIRSAIASGRGAASFQALADRLSRKIKVAAKVKTRAISRDIDNPAAEVSSASTEAFELYSRGYRMVNRGQLEESFRCLQKAVGIDPGFGLAYKVLFQASVRAGRNEDLAEFAETAIRLPGGISERERLLLEAEYFGQHKRDRARSLEANERLWALYPEYPDAPGGRQFLPRLYMETEDYDKMIGIFERMAGRRRKRSGDPFALLSCYLATGRYEKAEKYIEEFAALNPGHPDAVAGLRHNLLVAQRRFDEALTLDGWRPGEDPRPANVAVQNRLAYGLWASDDLDGAERVYSLRIGPDRPGGEDPRLTNLAVVALSKGQIGRMSGMAQQGIELALRRGDPGMEGQWRYLMAVALRISGRLPEALAESEAACRAYKKTGSTHLAARQLRALITLELGRDADFERQIGEIREAVESGPNPKLMRVVHHLLGQRELRRGNGEDARAHFWRALDLLPGVRQGLADGDAVPHFYAMAEALVRSGADKDAIPYYEKVATATAGRSWSGHIYARSFYGLAKAHLRLAASIPDEAAAHRDRAISHLGKFLSLWRDADPLFPEIEDARLVLAVLEAGPPDTP